MTEPPRFLPIASMSPDLNLRAAIPIKKGVAAIIMAGLLFAFGAILVMMLPNGVAGVIL